MASGMEWGREGSKSLGEASRSAHLTHGSALGPVWSLPPRGPPGFLPLLECRGQSWGSSRVSDDHAFRYLLLDAKLYLLKAACRVIRKSSFNCPDFYLVYLRAVGLDCHSQPGVPFASGKWTPSLDTAAIHEISVPGVSFSPTTPRCFSIPGGPAVPPLLQSFCPPPF